MRKIFLFAFTLFILSCGRNFETIRNGSDNKIIRLRIVSSPDSIISEASVIADDIEFIPLQHPAGIRIEAIDKIIARDNKIYISLINNLICFDNHGNFLYKLFGNGNDADENLVAIYDFDIDSADTTLIVLAGNKLLHFKISKSGFEFLETIKLNRLSPSKLDFVPGTHNVLVSSTRSKGFEPILHIVLNMEGDTLFFKQNNFKRFNPVKNRIWDMIIHYQSNNELHFKERFNDTIFSIDTKLNRLTASLIMDSRLSSSNSDNIYDPDYFKVLPNVINIFEDSRFLYYAYNFSDVDHKVFYDKYENIKYEIDPVSGVLKDDIAGGPDFCPLFFSEGKIFSWVSAIKLKDFAYCEFLTKEEVRNSLKQDELEKMISYSIVKEYPLLILLTLKN